jgi:hypothetical protein
MLNARLSLPVLVAVATVAGEVFFFVSSALFYRDDFHRIDISALNQPRFETCSLPALSRSYPRHFTFYVAHPIRSIR